MSIGGCSHFMCKYYAIHIYEIYHPWMFMAVHSNHVQNPSNFPNLSAYTLV